jgi:hypothetical protein
MIHTRRDFLMTAAAAVSPAKPRVAAIVTSYYYYSHADVIVGRILDGYLPNGKRVEPRTRIVSMYTDQVAEKDLSRGLSAKHGFPIYPTVAEALTLGGDSLAVDAVLLVGEHGNYPTNERGQKLYPRHELMGRIVEVFRKSGRSVPLFCDKHLSYSWEKAGEMYRWSRELKFPFMAGSSIPVTVRRPELELEQGCRIEHAVGVGYADLDAYGFHTLEGLQCMVERRNGGEKGVAAVRWLEGDAVWNWRDGEGRWSAPLLDAALAVSKTSKPGTPEKNVKQPVAFLLEYRDGLRAACYLLTGQHEDFLFAGKLKGRSAPVATNFLMETERKLPHFDGLVHCIEEMFVTRRAVYPVERTLLTSQVLSLLFESREKKARVETPQLNVSYRVPKNTYFQRE